MKKTMCTDLQSGFSTWTKSRPLSPGATSPTLPGSMPSLSFTATLNGCLQPMWRSVVCTETTAFPNQGLAIQDELVSPERQRSGPRAASC
jgi:hypothetical protein